MMLRVDVWEEGDEVVVEADAPGFGRADLVVRATDLIVRIEGAALGDEGPARRYHRRERRAGTVRREIPLPAAVDSAAARASLRDGVLVVRLPRAREAAGREAPIAVYERAGGHLRPVGSNL